MTLEEFLVALIAYQTEMVDGSSVDGSSVDVPSITCPRCQKTSYNVNDVIHGYCGYCHIFHADPYEGLTSEKR